jgi:hypothetical protein
MRDSRQYILHISPFEHVDGGNAQYKDFFRCEPCVAAGIVRSPMLVTDAVYLHREALGRAVEIENVRSNRVLAANDRP